MCMLTAIIMLLMLMLLWCAQWYFCINNYDSIFISMAHWLFLFLSSAWNNTFCTFLKFGLLDIRFLECLYYGNLVRFSYIILKTYQVDVVEFALFSLICTIKMILPFYDVPHILNIYFLSFSFILFLVFHISCLFDLNSSEIHWKQSYKGNSKL